MPLEYDNSAWYYFSMTMLTFYVMPTTYWAVGYTYRALTPNRVRKGEEVRTTLEKTKALRPRARADLKLFFDSPRFSFRYFSCSRVSMSVCPCELRDTARRCFGAQPLSLVEISLSLANLPRFGEKDTSRIAG